MYSKSSWGGPVDPFIHVKFTDVGKDEGDDPVVSLLIFDWMDQGFLDVLPEGADRAAICQPEFVDAGYCNQTDIGKFLVSPNATEQSVNVILTEAIHLQDSKPIKYPIAKTGYFCVVTEKFGATNYEAIIEFRNAYGELPATQIPKLPFYGGITLAYALVLVCVSQRHLCNCRQGRASCALTNMTGSGGFYTSNTGPTYVSTPVFSPLPLWGSTLIWSSGRAKLHHGHSHFLGH